MKPFKIKAFLTYVSYVTILIMHNKRAQQLTFYKMASLQDHALSILRKESASGALISMFQ